jgi:hypothetical protein
MGLLVLSAASTLAAASSRSPQPAPQALLRIDLQYPGDLESIAAAGDVSGLPVYAQMHNTSGQVYLLLPADTAQQETLSGLGFAIKILDSDIQSGSYYLLYARSPDALQIAGKSAQILSQDILAQDILTALVKASPVQAKSLHSHGIEIVRLQLHPLVIPDPHSPAWPEIIDRNPTIQGMIDQVSLGTVYSYDAGLSGEFPVTIGGAPYTILTRSSHTIEPIQKATQYVYEHFEALGLPTAYFTYTLPTSGPSSPACPSQSAFF